MNTDDPHIPTPFATSKEEIAEALEELKARYARGEIRLAAVRLYHKDGTFEDVVLGAETEEERAQALESLQRQIRSSTH